MGVSYLTCGICGEIFPDYISHDICANCGKHICETCYEDQRDKYTTVTPGTKGYDDYSEYALSKCDLCCKRTINDLDIINYFVALTGISKESVVLNLEKLREDK